MQKASEFLSGIIKKTKRYIITEVGKTYSKKTSYRKNVSLMITKRQLEKL